MMADFTGSQVSFYIAQKTQERISMNKSDVIFLFVTKLSLIDQLLRLISSIAEQAACKECCKSHKQGYSQRAYGGLIDTRKWISCIVFGIFSAKAT